MTRSIRSLRWWAPATAAVLLVTSLVPALAAEPTETVTTADVCADVPADAFRDVPAGNLHRANIDCVAAHGIVLGVGGGNYAPARPVTRGQMASFLVNLVEVADGEEADRSQLSQPFADTVGTTHGDNVAVAAQLGIARGLDARTFGPHRDVTRAQMATFVVQSIIAAGGSLPAAEPGRFRDLDGSVHAANIRVLAAAGIVSGVGDDAYDPAGTVSRAQMATFLAGAIRHLVAEGRWPEPPAEETDARVELTGIVRAGTAVDLLELRWSSPVTAQAAASGYRVLGADGTTVVARGTEVVAAGAQALHVRLDAALQGDATYWLELPAGAVVGDDASASEAATVAFVFSASGNGSTSALPVVSGVAVGGVAVAAGASITVQEPEPVLTGTAAAAGSTVASVSYRVGGGSWATTTSVDGAFDAGIEAFTATLGPLAVGSHGIEVRAVDARGLTSASYALTIEVGPLVPTIMSVVTDPAENRLVVTFDTAVVCPDTANGRANWSFVRPVEDGPGGAPGSVISPDSAPTTCLLDYSHRNIEPGNGGVLHYTDHGYSDGAVTAVGGAPLASVSGIVVTPGS